MKTPLEKIVQDYFLQKKWTLSTAESCTGGALGATLIKIPDSSLYYQGGIIAYQNRIKEELLGVSSQLLKEKGAVNEEVASAMAQGVYQRFHSSVGVGITGIAGPSGGSKEKPVGTVCFALVGEFRKSWVKHFLGSREVVIQQAVESVLAELIFQFESL